MTVSQAVIQIGMKPLADLCSTLVLVQKFIPAARQGGPLATCLRKTIITSLLSNSITSSNNPTPMEKKNETGHLLGWLSEMGTLLLAYYFPNIYENAKKREVQRNISFEEALQQIIGMTPIKLSVEVLKNFELPPYFKDVLAESESMRTTPKTNFAKNDDLGKAAAALNTARAVSENISSGGNAGQLEEILKKSKTQLTISEAQLNTIVGSLTDQFKDYCSTVDISLSPIPEYVAILKDDPNSKKKEEDKDDGVSQLIDEIRNAVESREPTASILTSAMEALALGLKFDRVVLLLATPSRKELVGRMSLGEMPPEFNPTSYMRIIDPPMSLNAPEAIAMKEGKPIFKGPSLFPGGWPLTAIPIGFGKRTVGIIYADKVDSKDDGLSPKDQSHIGVIAELLDRSLSSQRG